MNYNEQAGMLILGSRFRRLSENFLAAVNAVYQSRAIAFEAGWFPVFFLLHQREFITITEVASAMGCSQPTASGLVRTLKEKELISMSVHPGDARSQQLSLTKRGKKLLQEILPVWTAMEQAFAAHFNEHLIKDLAAMDELTQPQLLIKKINEKLS